MKKKIIKLFQECMEELYQDSRQILLAEESYTGQRINFKNVYLFLAFLESTVEKHYNRLRTLSIFLNYSEDLPIECMYPFALLTKQAKDSINEKETKGVKLATALDVSEIDENYVALWEEEQLKNEVAQV